MQGPYPAGYHGNSQEEGHSICHQGCEESRSLLGHKSGPDEPWLGHLRHPSVSLEMFPEYMLTLTTLHLI